MWVGTGCGGISQVRSTMSVPVQDVLGGTIPLAEAVGARPIADTAAATANTPASQRLMLCPVLVTQASRRAFVERRSWRAGACLRGVLVAMSIS
jgi:hypothetical protein